MNKYKLLSVILALLLGVSIFRNNSSNDYTLDSKADTIYITRIDTQFIPKPVMVEKNTIDTIYIETNNKSVITLPVERKVFSDNSTYKAIVSGYKPNLESIEVYNRNNTKFVTITNNKTIVSHDSRIYAYGGLGAISGTLIPKVGICMSTPKKWLISLETGLHGGSMYYGFNLGCKIN